MYLELLESTVHPILTEITENGHFFLKNQLIFQEESIDISRRWSVFGSTNQHFPVPGFAGDVL